MKELTAQQGEQRHPAIVRQGVDVLVPVRLPDKVDDHIDAFPVRRLLDLLGKILSFVVHHMSGPLGKAEQALELLSGRCGGRDGISEIDDQREEFCGGGAEGTHAP